MLVLPFLLPMHRYPVQSFYQEWIAMALGSVAFLALGMASQERRIEAPRVVLLPLGVCLLLAVQTAGGKLPYWQQGALGALYLLWAAAVAALGYGLRRRLGWPAFAALFAWVLVAGALATGALALAQLAGWGGKTWVMPLATTRLYGNLGQPNHFADYVSLGLISVVYLATTGRLATPLAAAAALFFLTILNFSGSRAVWIYLAAAVALSLYLHARKPAVRSRALLAWTSGLLLAALLIQGAISVAPVDSSRVAETVGARLAQDTGGVAVRLRYAQAALAMLREAPLLGTGFETFAWHHFLRSASLPPHAEAGVADHAHNVLFQLAAEFGFLGVALLVAAAWLWLAAQRRSSFDPERWWACTLLTTLLAHSLLEYPLWYAYFLGVFALLLGAAEERAWRFSSPALDRIAFAGAAVLALWTLGSVLHDYRRLEVLARGHGGSALEFERMRAEALHLHGHSLFAHLVEFGLARSIRLEPKAIAEKIAINGRAMRYLPTADMAFRHSALLALGGRLDDAFQAWDLATAAYPAQAPAVLHRLREIARHEQPALHPLVEYAASR
ncbi:MAG TPA: Wzy polymerase domain-containing protein [Burkholderiales bacterium]|nr:Wzy polymerase domain-containing protein [Burkholderiales bacterium]